MVRHMEKRALERELQQLGRLDVLEEGSLAFQGSAGSDFITGYSKVVLRRTQMVKMADYSKRWHLGEYWPGPIPAPPWMHDT